jgi:hypothetical protein
MSRELAIDPAKRFAGAMKVEVVCQRPLNLGTKLSMAGRLAFELYHLARD